MEYQMRLLPGPFLLIKRGAKTVEVRLFDTKRRELRPGDYILFTETNSQEQLRVCVLEIRRYNDFSSLVQDVGISALGYDTGFEEDGFVRSMYTIYSPDDEQMFGVCAIFITKAK